MNSLNENEADFDNKKTRDFHLELGDDIISDFDQTYSSYLSPALVHKVCFFYFDVPPEPTL